MTSNVASLLADVARVGVRLVAAGDRLRYWPKSAMNAELLCRVAALKGELLLALGGEPDEAPTAEATAQCDRCGRHQVRDTWIHDGQSLRRDCAHCGRTQGFPVWYGRVVACEDDPLQQTTRGP